MPGLALGAVLWISYFGTALVLSGCAGEFRELKQIPGEARTFAVSGQNELWRLCAPTRFDDGRVPGFKDELSGCYRADLDMIFLEDSCRGAKAERHERAHRAGVDDPAKAGYNW